MVVTLYSFIDSRGQEFYTVDSQKAVPAGRFRVSPLFPYSKADLLKDDSGSVNLEILSKGAGDLVTVHWALPSCDGTIYGYDGFGARACRFEPAQLGRRWRRW